MNFSKLRISPRHYGMDLMPGEGDKITVTVKNPNNEIVSMVPTVKRILPETSAKFYASKTCLSVTWSDVWVYASNAATMYLKLWKATGLRSDINRLDNDRTFLDEGWRLNWNGPRCSATENGMKE